MPFILLPYFTCCMNSNTLMVAEINKCTVLMAVRRVVTFNLFFIRVCSVQNLDEQGLSKRHRMFRRQMLSLSHVYAIFWTLSGSWYYSWNGFYPNIFDIPCGCKLHCIIISGWSHHLTGPHRFSNALLTSFHAYMDGPKWTGAVPFLEQQLVDWTGATRLFQLQTHENQTESLSVRSRFNRRHDYVPRYVFQWG